jgi:putative sigma-54 modulation protein
MQLTVTGRHLVVSEAVRRQIEQKLVKLDRLLNDSAMSAQCVLAHEGRLAVCELTVHVRGDHTLVGLGRAVKMAAAVAAAVAKVSQQAQRLADRWKTRRRGAKPQAEAVADGVVEKAAPSPRVIRARDYDVKALTVEDAVSALERGKQPVVVFRRSPTDAIAVVFRRPDGHVGLIDTEE